MQKILLLATTNKGKQAEMTALLADENLDLRTPQDLGLTLRVVEDGGSYAANAMLKAKAFSEASALAVLADDSGLEVDALDGAPGLFSARFSPKPGATDADRRALLVATLTPHPRPWTARFSCTMAFVLPDGREFIHTGLCEGEIIPEERGTHGFGYDPIFVCKEPGVTMAELNMDEKNRLSHRARALAGLRAAIRGNL